MSDTRSTALTPPPGSPADPATEPGTARPGTAPGVRARTARETNPWLSFALRRLGGVLLSFVILVVVTFLIVPLIPGDPAAIVAGEGASQADVAAVRAELGLDQPLLVAFGHYVAGIFRGDLGTSYISGVPVTDVVFSRLPFTAEIALMAIVLTLVVAIPLGMTVGILTRSGRNRWLDTAFGVATGFFFSVPQYVMGTLLVTVFAVMLGWVPAAGATTYSSLILPTLALMIGPICSISRVVRRETAVVLDQDYIRTAQGWRLPIWRTHIRYALPNLVTTTLTLSGLILSGMLGGAIVMETIFAWPGLGTGIVTAVISRDYPVIQGTILVLGMLATFIIIAVDVVLGIIDPRTLGGRHDDI